jgi:hypothetical protein
MDVAITAAPRREAPAVRPPGHDFSPCARKPRTGAAPPAVSAPAAAAPAGAPPAADSPAAAAAARAAPRLAAFDAAAAAKPVNACRPLPALRALALGGAALAAAARPRFTVARRREHAAPVPGAGVFLLAAGAQELPPWVEAARALVTEGALGAEAAGAEAAGAEAAGGEGSGPLLFFLSDAAVAEGHAAARDGPREVMAALKTSWAREPRRAAAPRRGEDAAPRGRAFVAPRRRSARPRAGGAQVRPPARRHHARAVALSRVQICMCIVPHHVTFQSPLGK